ncbi:MAG: hypothetical protein Q4G35_06535 [Propionibacteriaceae bacterium]|nr:hypothetical protein [Propionibacteriaceae bacterium]
MAAPSRPRWSSPKLLLSVGALLLVVGVIATVFPGGDVGIIAGTVVGGVGLLLLIAGMVVPFARRPR